jgi:uncharacterized protein YbjT (DUF2867 family)
MSSDSKLLTVFGATGAQGGSVVNDALGLPGWRVRGLTRNASSNAAKALTARGVEVVSFDINDASSVVAAIRDSHAIYAVTDFWEHFAKVGPDEAVRLEVEQGSNIVAAAAKSPSLQHFIWSTLPDSKTISGGRVTVPHMDAKVQIERLILADRALLAKTTFFWVGYYASNFVYPMIAPYHIPTADTWIQLGDYSPDTPVALVGDPRRNIGPLVAAVLAQPDMCLGGAQVFACAERYTATELLALWGRAAGRKVSYVRTDTPTYHALWPMWAKEMGLMMQFWDLARERSWTRDQGRATILLPEDLHVKLGENTVDVFRAQLEREHKKSS